MLLNMRDLLKVAKENHFTIGAFNVTEVSNFNCVFEVAEELQSPTIIAVAVNELDFCEKEYYSYIREKLMNSRVPYCLHLDHGDSMKSCLRAIQSGFTSVMIDGSHLPFEENIAITKQVVDIAHLLNVSVEGELGTIGDLGNSDEGGAEKIIFTQPAEAKEFIDRTGVDTLAIAIGTSHGLYPEGFKPELQLDLLAKIVEKVDLPLVLHGGSGQDDNQIREASKLGIQKINVASEYKAAISFELARIINEEQDFKFSRTLPKAILAGKEVVRHKMKVFGSDNKSHLYY